MHKYVSRELADFPCNQWARGTRAPYLPTFLSCRDTTSCLATVNLRDTPCGTGFSPRPTVIHSRPRCSVLGTGTGGRKEAHCIHVGRRTGAGPLQTGTQEQ